MPGHSIGSELTGIEEIAARLQRLEDIENIKQLKARYCAFCDDNYNPEGVASLFTEDGVWDGGQLGQAEGRQAIIEFFQRAPSAFSFAIHHVMNPIIEIQSDTATGRWYLFQPLVRKSGNREAAMWLAGRYEDEYVRIGGEWKFKRLKFITRFLAPYEEGWTKSQRK
jgi:limonene-1,2-epoxide hydrolase